MYRNLNNLLHF